MPRVIRVIRQEKCKSYAVPGGAFPGLKRSKKTSAMQIQYPGRPRATFRLFVNINFRTLRKT
jgi:hypothetical protein